MPGVGGVWGCGVWAAGVGGVASDVVGVPLVSAWGDVAGAIVSGLRPLLSVSHENRRRGYPLPLIVPPSRCPLVPSW